MDSFFWGFLKDIMNHNNNDTIQEIKDHFQLEINKLNNNSDV